MKSFNAFAGLTCLVLVMLADRADAQARERRVAVAVVEHLSQADARAEILRFSDPARPDVILLPRTTAIPDDLAAAIAAYRLSLRRTPVRSGVVGRTIITERSLDATAAAPLRQRAAAMLREVQRAPSSRVGNYGPGRWSAFQVRVDE